MNHTSTKKPEAAYDHKVDAFGGREITVHKDGRYSACFIQVSDVTATPSDYPSLSLVGESRGVWYAGYRDGRAQCDKVSISVDLAGSVTIQVVVGHNDVRTISLAELERIVSANDTQPIPA